MSVIKLMDLLQQDIENIKELLKENKYKWLKATDFKKIMRADILNLQTHLEEFIKRTNYL